MFATARGAPADGLHQHYPTARAGSKRARELAARRWALIGTALAVVLWILWAAVLPIGIYGFPALPTGSPRANLR